MRLYCTVCETQPAIMLCSADEALLCGGCDARVHATGKKHARAKLTSRAPFEQPKCDICQEATAFVFCREDRAVLCRRCDFSVHTANKLAETHERILLANVTVSLNSISAATESTSDRSAHKLSLSDDAEPTSSKSRSSSGDGDIGLVPDLARMTSRQHGKQPMGQAGSQGVDSRAQPLSQQQQEFKGSKGPDLLPQWRVDELLDIPGLADGYGIHDVDAMVAGDLDVGDMDDFDFSYLLQVPDMDAFVPSTSSPRSHHQNQATGSKHGRKSQPEPYSSDDGLGVPDLDMEKAKRART